MRPRRSTWAGVLSPSAIGADVDFGADLLPPYVECRTLPDNTLELRTARSPTGADALMAIPFNSGGNWTVYRSPDTTSVPLPQLPADFGAPVVFQGWTSVLIDQSDTDGYADYLRRIDVATGAWLGPEPRPPPVIRASYGAPR